MGVCSKGGIFDAAMAYSVYCDTANWQELRGDELGEGSRTPYEHPTFLTRS
jgi:hypothetical protein